MLSLGPARRWGAINLEFRSKKGEEIVGFNVESSFLWRYFLQNKTAESFPAETCEIEPLSAGQLLPVCADRRGIVVGRQGGGNAERSMMLD